MKLFRQFVSWYYQRALILFIVILFVILALVVWIILINPSQSYLIDFSKMDITILITEILKAICWPITTFTIVLILIHPKIGLIGLIRIIKYKDWEIILRDQLQDISNKIPSVELENAKDQLEVNDSINIDLAISHPSESILESWKSTQQLIYEKLIELYPTTSPDLNRITPERASQELLITGALPPNAEDILNRLWIFQDGIRRHISQEVTSEIANQYHELNKYIQFKVSSLTELPKMRVGALTYMILIINEVIDSGKHQGITIKEIEDEIEKGTIIDFLSKLSSFDVNIIHTTYPNFQEFYIKRLQDMPIGDERKWGIENSGLCLLLAWTNEKIKQGSGWYPSY